MASKSLPPLGTYTEATMTLPAGEGTVAQAMRCSKSKPGCEQAGNAPTSVLATRIATPE